MKFCAFACARAAALALGLSAVAALPARAGGVCPGPDSLAPEQWHDQHIWQALARRHYVIGTIRVHVAQVYELDRPGENLWFMPIADALHIKTHPKVVRDQLLFQPGDRVDPRVIYETERHLRGLIYLRASDIVPVGCRDGRVDVDVNVKDAWTLKPEVTFKRIGGQNIVNFRVTDENFFGSGKTISLGHVNSTQRSDNYLSYLDPALAGSRWQLFASADNLSDGSSHAFAINRPFFEDTTPWAGGANWFDQTSDVNFYNATERAYAAADHTHQLSLSWKKLIAWDGISGWRAGARYLDESYRYGPLVAYNPAVRAAPALPDRTFRGVQGTLSFFQDRYASFQNLRLVHRPEDYNLGWSATAALGYFPTRLGSSSDAWIGSLEVGAGTTLPGAGLLLWHANLSGRHARGAWRNAAGNAGITFYNQAFSGQTLVAHAAYDWRLRPDPETQLYLGGLRGLRGYPNYFRTGNRSWRLTLADRFATSTVIYQTFQLGYVAFVDSGRIDQLDGGWSRVFTDVGGGLRLGNLRGSFGTTIYLTVAVPLVKTPRTSPYQIVVGDVIDF